MKSINHQKQIDWMITIVPFSSISFLCLLFFLIPNQSNEILSMVRFILGDTFGVYYLARIIVFPFIYIYSSF